MASGPITSWQIDGETMETVTDFIFLCSKITADGDCIHEIKRHLLLGRKAVTNLDNILKSRDITLPTKVLLVKAIVFLVVIYRCEGWAIKNAEVKWKSLSGVQLFVTPWAVTCQAPLYMELSRQEYWMLVLVLLLVIVGSLSLLQGIFPTQGLNLGIPRCRWILYCLNHQESPKKAEHQRTDDF